MHSFSTKKICFVLAFNIFSNSVERKNMDLKKIKQKILWATIEDYPGLWEILWEINFSINGSSITENKKIVQALLIDFFNKGLIEFFWCIEPYENLKK